MMTHGLITSDAYICSIELGNEIVGGRGIVEIKDFSISLGTHTLPR